MPWIGIKDATENHGRVISDTYQHTNEIGIANSSARVLPTHTVCLSRTASVGYVVVMGRPMATSQDFVNWVCSDAIDWRFLKYVLLAERSAFLRFASGTTHQTIYFPEAKAFHVCLPPIGEQRAIGHILGTLDDKIELNRCMTESVQNIAHALLAHWEHLALESPDRRRWQSVSLADCGAWVSGGTPSKSNPAYWNGSIPWISAKSMHDFVISDSEDRVTGAGAQNGTRLIPPAAVVFVVRGMSLATEFRVGVTRREVTINQDLKAVLPRPGLSGPMLGYALQRRASEILEMTDEASHGTKRLQTDRIGRFTIMLPSDDRLADEGRYFDDLFARQASLREEATTLAALRDTLLPRFLSGELRVRDAEPLLAAVV